MNDWIPVEHPPELVHSSSTLSSSQIVMAQDNKYTYRARAIKFHKGDTIHWTTEEAVPRLINPLYWKELEKAIYDDHRALQRVIVVENVVTSRYAKSLCEDERAIVAYGEILLKPFKSFPDLPDRFRKEIL